MSTGKNKKDESGKWTRGHDDAAGSIEGRQSDGLVSRQSDHAAADFESVEERAELTQPMRDFVGDEVVLSLYEQNLITWPEIFQLVQSTPATTVLWRALADSDSIDSSTVFFEAARLNGIPMAEVTESDPGDDIVRPILDLFDTDTSVELLKQGILPLEIESAGNFDSYSIVVATHDPLGVDKAAVQNLLGKPVILRYAANQIIQLRIRRLDILPDESEMAPAFEDEMIIAGALDDDFFNTFIAPSLQDMDGGFSSDIVNQGDFGGGHGTDTPMGSGIAVGDGDGSSDPVTGWSVSGNEGNGNDSGYQDIDLGGHDDSDDISELAVEEISDSSKADLRDSHSHLNIKDRVVVMLLHKQVVTSGDVERAMEERSKHVTKDALWRYLAAAATDSKQEAIYAEAASVYAFKDAELGPGRPDTDFAKLVMEAFNEERRDRLFQLRVIPVEYEADSATGGAKLVFATHDPARPELHRFLQQLKLGRFELQYAPEAAITKLFGDIFPKKNEYLERISDDPLAVDLGTSYEATEKELIDEDALEAEISRSSLINLFEASLVEATRQGASDIHIFPNARRQIDIFFRVDGRLSKWHTEDRVHPESFLAVVKDNAMNVDRFERDMAQDGFIQRHIDDALIRFRVSVLPIATASQEVRAESIVIRVLDDRKVLTDLKKLGMLEVALDRFDKAIRQPHGMVILTGPTGSGKSTTLVAALHQVVSTEVNVLTVEDPVEYIIKGVRQIKLSHKLSLEGALRAILRHDPDIVMVGEMRDRSTAELAIKLANTGHLTFSTLHTNDAPSAVSRLYKMGVEPFLIAYAINLVVAQRLIRILCPTCRVEDTDPDTVLLKSVGYEDEEIEATTFYMRGQKDDCPTCHGIGYKGRRAMCETLYFSREIRHMIVESGEAIDEDSIREQGRSEGMLTLLDSAREIVKMGETSVEELIRVTSTE